MRPLLQDKITKRGCRWSNEGGVSADPGDGPVGVTTMTGRHVVGDGGVLAVAASALMDGDALAFDKNLDGPAGEACFDFSTGEAVGNAVEVLLDLDVIIDADPADAPLSKDARFDRQGVERWSVEFFEQLLAGAAEPAEWPFLIEPLEQRGDRGIELGKAIELPMTQPRQNPPLDDEHRHLDLSLVAPGRVGSTAVP